MKNLDNKSNIFLIMDSLDEYTQFLKIDSPQYKLHTVYFNKLKQYIDDYYDTLFDNNIVVVIQSSDSINKVLLEKIRKIFYEKFNLDTLHIIYLLKEQTLHFESDEGLSGDTYFYLLPSKDIIDLEIYSANFVLYINILIQMLLHKDRINNYIIDSFRSIVDAEIIKKQKIEIEKLNHTLNELSRIDYLANILNRRAFFEELEKERNQTLRSLWRIMNDSEVKNAYESYIRQFDKRIDNCTKHTDKFFDHFGNYSIILIDIDFFKKINDNKGHLIGDRVLKKLGEMLKSRELMRISDIAGRYGGEEFIILLRETNSMNARVLADRLRRNIKEENFYDNNDNIFHITVSMGISEFRLSDESNDDIINRADKALYYAKNHGRDMIILYEELINPT